MPKPTKTKAEIEQMIVDAVRKFPGCERFRSISIYRIVDPSAGGLFNWSPSVANYGEAGTMLCDDALVQIVPRLQRQYDMAED